MVDTKYKFPRVLFPSLAVIIGILLYFSFMYIHIKSQLAINWRMNKGIIINETRLKSAEIFPVFYSQFQNEDNTFVY